MNDRDQIHLSGLKVLTHLGVPREEREALQEISIDVTLWLKRGFSGEDDLSKTVDYEKLRVRIQEIVEEKERKLVEFLAEEVALGILCNKKITQVKVTIRKYVLPKTDYIAVTILRQN